MTAWTLAGRTAVVEQRAHHAPRLVVIHDRDVDAQQELVEARRQLARQLATLAIIAAPPITWR